MAEEITIDYVKMNAFKDVCVRLQHQISNDYQADNGSYMAKEDLMISSIICLLTKSYTVTKK